MPCLRRAPHRCRRSIVEPNETQRNAMANVMI